METAHMVTRKRNRSENATQQEGASAEAQVQDSGGNTITTSELQKYIQDAIQPVMQNLQQQIADTVREQLGGQSGAVGSNGASDSSEQSSSEGGIFQPVVDLVERVWQWILDKVQALGDKVAELVGELISRIVQRAIKSAF
jgi:hypothetical protein